MSSAAKREKKGEFIKKMYDRMSKYKQVVLVTLENVGSNQVQLIRKELGKSKAELLIGKNTVIRKALQMKINALDENMDDYQYFKGYGEPNPKLEKLKEITRGKIAMVFSDEPVFELKPIIESNKVDTVAKVGMIAPTSVVVPPGPTGMDPSQISFFHALNMTTKINKGQIEIMKDYEVCKKGELVSNSAAALLQKLNIKPFQFGMEIMQVYDDGTVLSPEVVALSPADLISKFQNSAKNITALSLQLGRPNEASVPHFLINAFKNIAALSMETGYKLAALEAAQQASSQQSAPSGGAAKKEEKPVETKQEEPEEEEDVDMGGLFD